MLESLMSDEERAYETWKTRYVLERGRKSSEGMLGRVKDGWFSGPAPLGYLNADTRTRMGIEVDKERSGYIQEAFRLLATGRSLRETLKEVTAQGLTSRDGKPLGYSSFQLIMTNPFYCGTMRFKGQFYPGKHEPLVSQEMFDIAQTQMEERALPKGSLKQERS